MSNLELKPVAVVFGGTGGIGAATIKALVGDQFQVYATFHTQQERADTLASEYKIEFFQADLSKQEDIARVLQTVFTKESRMNLIVNCGVGALRLKKFEDLATPEMQNEMNVIFWGTVYILKALNSFLKTSGPATFINISSMAVKENAARMSIYTAAKAAAASLCKSVSTEMKQLRIVTISPAFVETNLLKDLPPFLLKLEREKQQEKQLLQPEDIATVVSRIAASHLEFPTGTQVDLKSHQDIQKIQALDGK